MPRCAVPSVRLYSSTSRVSLAYEQHEPPKGGRSPKDAPIIFMHGLFGSRKNNRSVSKVLARDLKRHVYCVDLRNHGESPHNPQHDYLAMADDVCGFMEEHKLKSPTLIGHSMGAKTAMTVALSQPDLVRDIISVDNAPVDAALHGSFAKYIQAMRNIDEANVTRHYDADKILEQYESELVVRHFLLGNLHRPDGSTLKFRVPTDIMAKALDHMGHFPFKNPDEARFEKPALFIRGTQSRYVPDDVIPLIGRFFPRFSLVNIDAGHWVTSENPQEFLKATIDFLQPKE